MILASPWALLLLALPALWTILNGRRRHHRRRLVLTGTSAVVLVVALSQPKLSLRESRMAVAVLKDTSPSIAERELRRESEFIVDLEKSRGKHVVRVIPFTESMHQAADRERTEPWDLAHTPGPAGRGTDIETAVREGIATLPAGRVPRLVILSDGLENPESAEHAARQAQQLGIPIDTIPLVGRQQPDLRLDTEPVRPPDTNRGAVSHRCLVVVFESSSRMEGQKIELAKLAALGLIENLRRTDMVGVLTFGDTFRWAIPIQSAGAKDPLNHAIKEVTARGGVRIAAALAEALRRLETVQAGSKQVVILTDGTSQDPGAFALARKAAAQHVTVSTISIGENLNRRYFASLVGFSQGKSVFLRDPSGLDQASLVAAQGPQPVESRLFPVVRVGPPESLLQWISKSTGGRFNPIPSSIFEPDGRAVSVFLPLWPALVMFALGLTLFETIPGHGDTRRRFRAFPDWR
jgi:Mg-chelatase subunit ChlD